MFMVTYNWHIVWNKVIDCFLILTVLISNMVNIDWYNPQKSICGVLNNFSENNKILSPKSIRTTDLQESENFIFSQWKHSSLSSSAACTLLLQAHRVPGLRGKVHSFVGVLPALPQILTTKSSLFCPWHGFKRFTVIHSPWQGRDWLSSAPQFSVRPSSHTYEDHHFCLDHQSMPCWGLCRKMHLWADNERKLR